MAVLDIKIYPDKILRTRAKEVVKIDKDTRRIAFDMVETMRYAQGVGIAAPQVGISKRIIVVGDVENKNSALVLINPLIVKKKGKVSFCEGCLSLPGAKADIVRPEAIEINALNMEGKKLKIDIKGFLARVIQHEIDHLEGILFIDRVGFMKRKKIIKQISQKVCVAF